MRQRLGPRFRRHHRNIRPGAILDATPEEMEALEEIRAIKLIVEEVK